MKNWPSIKSEISKEPQGLNEDAYNTGARDELE